MTDESQGMGESGEPTPPSGAPQEEHDVQSVLAGAGDLTSGAGLVTLAGIVLLIIWLIFDVFLDDYGFSDFTLVLAVVAVLAPRLDPDTVRKIHPVPAILKMTGYALGVIGVFDVIGALESGFYDDAGTIIAALVSYVAFALAFIGARQIKL